MVDADDGLAVSLRQLGLKSSSLCPAQCPLPGTTDVGLEDAGEGGDMGVAVDASASTEPVLIFTLLRRC